MDSIALVTGVIVIIIIAAVIITLFALYPNNSIAVIQQSGIPTYPNESLLQSISKYKLYQASISSIEDLKDKIINYYSLGIRRFILQVDSQFLIGVESTIKLYSDAEFVSTASTVVEAREELQDVKFVLTPANVFLDGVFGSVGSGKINGVLLTTVSGDVYLNGVKDYAEMKGVRVYDLDGTTPLTSEEKQDILDNYPFIFISAFVNDQQFLIDQIPDGYINTVVFVNIPPSSTESHPSGPYYIVEMPKSTLMTLSDSEWNESITGSKNATAHVSLLSIPALCGAGWDYLEKEGMFYRSSLRSAREIY